MLNIIIDITRPLTTSLLAILLATFVALRIYVYKPEAFLSDGLLHFNLQGYPQIVLIGVILGIWFPAIMIVSGRVARAFHVPGLKGLMLFAYGSLALATAVFFSARTSVMIIASFVVIEVIFAALSVLNILLPRLAPLSGGQHANRE